MHAAKQIRLSRNVRRSSRVSSASQVEDRVDPPEAELGLGLDRRDVLDRGERLVPLVLVGDVGVEQGQVELDVHRLLEQLAGQVEPALGAVDVLVEVEHQVVGHDRVAGGEERDQPGDQVPLGGGEPLQVGEVGVQVDLLDRPGVLDRVAVAVVEVRVAHRPQGQVHAGVEQHLGLGGSGHWQASQVSGFSSEQASGLGVGRDRGRRWAGDAGRRLLDPGGRARAQVVRGLQPGLPGVAGTSRRACRSSGRR